MSEDYVGQLEHAKQQLETIVKSYLTESDVQQVMRACVFAEKAHDGVTRKSGEPYIMHPIAVASLLAGRMRMDAHTVMAALLHDVIEDTPVSKEELATTFHPTVAELVDGVTKLTSSSDKQFNKAASFRKFLQATLHDPRVIIIKLSDRYHNMTTLGALRPDKRARIAQETFDVFVPMARLVGMNEIADWLENLCYQNLDLELYEQVQNALAETKEDRCQYQKIWEERLHHIFEQHHINGRLKKKNNNTELLRRFVKNQIDLQRLTRSHNFDVIVQTIQDCDTVYRHLQENFTVLSFVDHIRRPMPGGNQALITELKGPHSYITLTIQTELMRRASRFGVVLGEAVPPGCRTAIQASLKNLNGLIDDECAKTTFNDLLDYLHQEKMIAYSPKGNLFELPRGATAVDFAYAASLFLGNHAIGCKINNVRLPLSTTIEHGQVVEIMTDVLASPDPDWLGYVNTQKARRAIQNFLRDQSPYEQIIIGEEALDRALKAFGGSTKTVTDEQWAELLAWRHLVDRNQLFEQIATGDLLPQLVANRLISQYSEDETSSESLIKDTEGVDVKYAHCCNPIIGDKIYGHLTRRGLIIHRKKCPNLAQEKRLHPENIMSLTWQNTEHASARFNVYLTMNQVLNDEQISQLIYLVRQGKAGVETVQTLGDSTYFSIVVNDRPHIAYIITELRKEFGLTAIRRLLRPIDDYKASPI